MKAAIEKMKMVARKLDNVQLVEAAKTLTKPTTSEDERLARAVVLDVYLERCGEAATDVLMDELGM